MLKISDVGQSNPSYELNKSNQSDGLSDLFKSIYNLKIDNKIENSKEVNFQNENNYPLSTKEVSRKSTSIDFNQKRSELQLKAETAKKKSDLDIQNAKDLLEKIDQRLDKKVNKKLRITRGHLKSAVRGLSKLVAEKEGNKASISEEKRPEATSEISEAIDAGDKIVLQFNDTKIAFTLAEGENKNAQAEVYEGEISITSKTLNDKLGSNSNELDESIPKNSLSQQESKDTGEALKQIMAEEENLGENGNKIAKKIMELVEEKSAVAAELIAEDANIKIEIEPQANNAKQNSVEKVISANQVAANILVMPQENLDNQVSKIVPSGNLKELLSTQNGLLEVASAVEVPVLVDTEEIVQNLATKKENIPGAEINTMAKKEFLELSPESALGNTGSKLAQNAASASVLDRINQVAMVQKISKRIQLRQLKEFGIVNIHLDPPELGKLIVKLSIKNKDIKVSIIADCDSSHEMLKNHKQIFMKSLRESGLEVTEFNVSTQENTSQNNFFNSNNQESQPSSSVKTEVRENKNNIIKDDPLGALSTQDLNSGHRISLIA